MVALLLIALSLGLTNFAASIAIGVSGVDRRVRLRIALSFAIFEAGMPIIGLALGHSLSHTLGSSAQVIGGLLLIATGAHTSYAALTHDVSDEAEAVATAGLGRLLVLAAALSIDNLVVGFALGATHTNLILSVIVITAMSVGLSLVGLELGGRLGARIEHNSEILGGIILTAVGIAVLINLL